MGRTLCAENIIKSGVYYYVRRVPKDVQKHYARDRVVICLKTKSLYAATRASRSVNAKLEDFWLSLRLQQISVPAHHLLQYQYSPTSSISEICGITMSYAMKQYFKLKGHGRGSLFFSHVRRAIKYAIDLLGDKDISLYSTAEASRLRDWMMERDMSTTTVKRNFADIKSVLNLSIHEHGLDIKNPFANMYLPTDQSQTRRPPFNIKINISITIHMFLSLINI